MEIKAEQGELRATIQIKRAKTGKVETYEIVGHADQEKLKQIINNHEAAGKTFIQQPTVHDASGKIVGEGASMSNKSQEK